MFKKSEQNSLFIEGLRLTENGTQKTVSKLNNNFFLNGRAIHGGLTKNNK
jgi:hypothetical protein